MLKDKEAGGEDRKTALGNDDIGIMTRLLTQEKMITGKAPIDPPMLDTELKRFYEKQTDALNSQRERLNELGAKNGQEKYLSSISNKGLEKFTDHFIRQIE